MLINDEERESVGRTERERQRERRNHPPSLHLDATVLVSYAMLSTLTLTHTRTIASYTRC